jgi:hypothetical protein
MGKISKLDAHNYLFINYLSVRKIYNMHFRIRVSSRENMATTVEGTVGDYNNNITLTSNFKSMTMA